MTFMVEKFVNLIIKYAAETIYVLSLSLDFNNWPIWKLAELLISLPLLVELKVYRVQTSFKKLEAQKVHTCK